MSGSDTRRSRTTFRVRYHETDQMGVVHHGAYVNWCEVGRTDYMRELGLSYAELERSGLYLAVTELSLRYHAPARYDDRVRVESWLERVQSRSVTFGYRVARSEPEPELRLASARSVLVALDGSGAPRRIPDEVLDAFRDAHRSVPVAP